MTLGIAIVVVLVLLAVALLPIRKRDSEPRQAAPPLAIFPQPPQTAEPTISQPAQPLNLRRQQLEEEAAAISGEYQRRADELWLEELRGKATTLLAPEKKTTKS